MSASCPADPQLPAPPLEARRLCLSLYKRPLSGWCLSAAAQFLSSGPHRQRGRGGLVRRKDQGPDSSHLEVRGVRQSPLSLPRCLIHRPRPLSPQPSSPPRACSSDPLLPPAPAPHACCPPLPRSVYQSLLPSQLRSQLSPFEPAPCNAKAAPGATRGAANRRRPHWHRDWQLLRAARSRSRLPLNLKRIWPARRPRCS